MVFRIVDPRANQKLFQYRILLVVLNYIKGRGITPAEKPLDDYLRENYNMNLTEAALLVVRRIKAQSDGGTTAIFSFMNSRFDRLASLITYGNGIFMGSTILRDAFRKAERNS